MTAHGDGAARDDGAPDAIAHGGTDVTVAKGAAICDSA